MIFNTLFRFTLIWPIILTMFASTRFTLYLAFILLFIGFFGKAETPVHAQTATPQGSTPETPRPQFPYSYPFTGADIQQKLNANPVFVELFTSLDCLFCPRAEHLIADLSRQTRAITLVCHTDPEGPDYPLSRTFCADTQERYSARLTDGLLYTPQMVINGQIDAVGHEFDDVENGLRTASQQNLPLLFPRPANQSGIYLVDLPAIKKTSTESMTLFMVTYRPPTQIDKKQRQSTTHPDPLVRVANTRTQLGSWDGRPKTITLSFSPNNEQAGFIVMVQNDQGVILAAGDSQSTTP